MSRSDEFFSNAPSPADAPSRMTDAPALPSLQDDATVTPRTDREVYTIRQQDIGFEAVGATLARTLERELAAAIAERDLWTQRDNNSQACLAERWVEFDAITADRNALQLALNAANGRADGLEVALQECRDTFNEYAEIHRAKGESGVSKMLANRALAERCNAALSTTPESPYKQAMREYFEAADKFEHDGPNEGDWDAVETAEQRCRTLLTDPQPDTKGQCNG